MGFVVFCIVDVQKLIFLIINSFPANGDFYCLLITFEKSVVPELDPNCFTLWWYSWKIFFEKVNLKKKSTKKHAKLPSMQRVKLSCKISVIHIKARSTVDHLQWPYANDPTNACTDCKCKHFLCCFYTLGIRSIRGILFSSFP